MSGRVRGGPVPASTLVARATWDQETNVVTASLPQRCYPRPASNPDAPAPADGRVFAYGSMDEIFDEIDGPPLTLDRG